MERREAPGALRYGAPMVPGISSEAPSHLAWTGFCESPVRTGLRGPSRGACGRWSECLRGPATEPLRLPALHRDLIVGGRTCSGEPRL